jgi:1-phosphofructokinase
VRVKVAVDADGAALREAASARVALLKPNLAELETLVGRPLPTLGEVIGAAQSVLARGVDGLLVSLGADGAVFVDADGATHAEARIDDVVNTVGAGDALLAGFLAGGGGRGALRSAVAWSVAACRSPGTRMRVVTTRDVDAVEVHDVVHADRSLAA